MRKKVCAFLAAALMAASLAVPVWAGEAHLSTSVPAAHTVTVVCGTGGSVVVDGEVYSGVSRFAVQRYDSFALTAMPDPGCALASIAASGDSGMTLSADGASLDRVSRDVTLTVVFRSAGILPDPGEPDPAVPTPAPSDALPPAPPAPLPSPGPTPQGQAEGFSVPVTGAEKQIAAAAFVQGDTAQVRIDDVQLRALLEGDAAELVSIDLSGAGAGVAAASIPVSAFRTMAQTPSANGGGAGLRLVMPEAEVRFDGTAVQAISRQAQGSTVVLRVEGIEAAGLTPAQQEALSRESDNAPLIQVTLRSGDALVTDFAGGFAEVRLPYSPRPGEDTSAITVWYVAADGVLEQVPCQYEDGFVLFTVGHFSEYLIRPGDITAGANGVQGPDNADSSAHCFICGLLGRSVAPLCWLIPLSAAVALGGILWYRYTKRRSKE